jgi:lipopolysaccharide heptosyltransferase I
MTGADPKRILLVKLSAIGDVVHALPVAAALRRRFPQAYIAWAVGPAAADVVTGNPHLDDVLVIGGRAPGARSLPGLPQIVGLRRALRAERFDLALDLQGLLKSSLVARLSGSPRRLGFRSRREGAFLLLTEPIVPERREIHAVDAYLGFADALHAPRAPIEFSIATSDADRRAAEHLLGGRADLAALIPGARWSSKRWPHDRFAALADALADDMRLTPVLLGAPGDAPLARAVQSAAHCDLLDLTGQTTLKQAAEVFRRCRVAVGNDTGPMYISAAVATPTVALFGPSDWRRLGPYGDGHAKLISGVACAPCRNRTCRPRICMEAITVDHVLDAVRRLLRAPQEAH